MTKKYVVTKDCFCFNRYWDKEEIVEFPDDFEAPHLFELVTGPIDPRVPVVQVPTTMFELNEMKKDVPKTGMSFVPKEKEPKPEEEKRKPGRPKKT